MDRPQVAALMTGLLLLCAVVTLTLAAGVAHRLRDGRLRAPRPHRSTTRSARAGSSSPMSAPGPPSADGTPATATAAAAPSARPATAGPSAGPATAAPSAGPATAGPSARPASVDPESGASDLDTVLADLGHVPGSRATLLQFSSAFCAPCRATRRVLQEVTAMVDGVTHVEVDAEQHLDLVRRLRIVKTPTTLVLDAQAREVKRASGQPRKTDVLRAIGQALP